MRCGGCAAGESRCLWRSARALGLAIWRRFALLLSFFKFALRSRRSIDCQWILPIAARHSRRRGSPLAWSCGAGSAAPGGPDAVVVGVEPERQRRRRPGGPGHVRRRRAAARGAALPHPAHLGHVAGPRAARRHLRRLPHPRGLRGRLPLGLDLLPALRRVRRGPRRAPRGRRRVRRAAGQAALSARTGVGRKGDLFSRDRRA